MILLNIIQRELTIAFRRPAEILNPLVVFSDRDYAFPIVDGAEP